MPMTTRSFRPDDRARLQECEAALLRLREQVRRIKNAVETTGFCASNTRTQECLNKVYVYTQGAEEILGNTLGDEPSP